MIKAREAETDRETEREKVTRMRPNMIVKGISIVCVTSTQKRIETTSIQIQIQIEVN